MASDRYNYVLTKSAEADIDEALAYIANELVNPDVLFITAAIRIKF